MESAAARVNGFIHSLESIIDPGGDRRTWTFRARDLQHGMAVASLLLIRHYCKG
jgi:hypothetical protein